MSFKLECCVIWEYKAISVYDIGLYIELYYKRPVVEFYARCSKIPDIIYIGIYHLILNVAECKLSAYLPVGAL